MGVTSRRLQVYLTLAKGAWLTYESHERYVASRASPGSHAEGYFVHSLFIVGKVVARFNQTNKRQTRKTTTMGKQPNGKQKHPGCSHVEL